MNRVFKWTLLALLSAIAVFLSGEAIGVDWGMLQATTFSFLVAVGLLLLLYTGSAAAIEAAKYYRNNNQRLE